MSLVLERISFECRRICVPLHAYIPIFYLVHTHSPYFQERSQFSMHYKIIAADCSTSMVSLIFLRKIITPRHISFPIEKKESFLARAPLRNNDKTILFSYNQQSKKKDKTFLSCRYNQRMLFISRILERPC